MNNELIVAIVVAVIGSQALAKIVDAIIERFKKPSAMQLGLKWLLQDKLDFLMTRDILKGSTTRSMKSFVERGYKIYHEDLKGNGDLASVYSDYEELEVDYAN